MKKTVKYILLLLLMGMFIFPMTSLAQEKVVLYFFYDQSCSVCAQAESFLAGLKGRYPNLRIADYEVISSPENNQFFQALSQVYGLAGDSVPTIFIGEKAFDGWSSVVAIQIEQEIIKCRDKGCISPVDRLKEQISPEQNSNQEGINQPWILSLGMIFIGGIIIFFSVRFYLRKKPPR